MSETTRAQSIHDSTLADLARRRIDADRPPWRSLDLSDPSQRVFGDYELLEMLGEGGMGVVFRAHQRSLRRDVAIKFIAAYLSADENMVGRLRSEAQAAGRLHHPHIVPVFEVGQVEDLHFFTMPLLRGRTLAELASERKLTIGECVDLMRKLASAVGYAHELGLLHLDLKPANIMLDERGEPLIGDFGLAREIDANGGVDAQEVSGTPAYMAPEQILIKRWRLTPATDVYALGAILYRLLTGHSPHGQGGSAELMDNASAGRVRPTRAGNPDVPRDLAAICDHCLQLDAPDRYRSAVELGQDLARFADGNAISIRTPSALERLLRGIRRHPRMSAALATATVVLIAAGSAAIWWQARIEEQAWENRVSTAIETMKFMTRDGPVYSHEGKCYAKRVRVRGVVFEYADPVECPDQLTTPKSP
jgi:serine/threonine protein kinase